MADETQILRNRFKELYNRSHNRGIYTYSDFLNMHEQTILYSEMKYGYTLCGGYEDAERKIVCFGDENDFGYAPQPPVSILLVAPLSEKFSDDLTHRDFLGSILGLGIKRETIGDIIISNNKGYVICLDSIAQYIIDNLTKVRHTSVYCEKCDSLPTDALPQPTEKTVIVSSLRLDGIISGVYNLSRSKSSALIDGERVFINGKLTTNNSAPLKEEDIISVRGQGRFRFKEISGDTRKGRIRILCEVW
jgi:RNA-binding protein YlmH